MKYLIFSLLLLLTACQLTPEQGARIESALGTVVTRLDRNADDRVTNEEVKDLGSSPSFWVAVVGLVGGLLGLGKAQSASSRVGRIESQTDELYDATHKPVGG